MAEPFQNQVVILTGASSGIGRAAALQLAGQKARLVLAARSVEQLEAAAAECRAAGALVAVVPADVSREEDCRRLVETAAQAYGRVDMLVASAGITLWAAFAEVTDVSIFEKVMRTNYLGSLYCAYYALPYLKQTRGRIVAVSSLAGKTGVPMRSGYAASKHAVTGFFDSLRIELEGTGVSVTVVYPGFVATGSQMRGFGPDGRPLGYSPISDQDVMQPEECARILLRAAARRKREEVMTARGKLGLWVKLIAPGLVDRIARRAIQSGR